MRLIKRLPTAEKPNGSVYAAPFRKVYVSNTNGKAVAIVDVEKDQIVKTLEFKSETGMPQYDSVAKKVYVNLRSTNEVAEVDPLAILSLGSTRLRGASTTTPWRWTQSTSRFLLCGGNRVMTVFALDTLKAIAHLPIPQGADVSKFDPGNGRIYAACSSGFISVFQELDADHFNKLEDFPVQNLVHSLAVDTVTHRVYAPKQEEDGKPVTRMIIYEPADQNPARH